MKIINIICIMAIMLGLSACGSNYVKVKTTDITPKDSKFKQLRIVRLNDSARKALGATGQEMIIMFGDDKTDGRVTIITSEDFNFKGNTKEIMEKAKLYKSGKRKGKKPRLVLEGQIRITENSPFCIEYRDTRGNIGWWPVPDCPHN